MLYNVLTSGRAEQNRYRSDDDHCVPYEEEIKNRKWL